MGTVIHFVMLVEVVTRDAAQILFPTDDHVSVRMYPKSRGHDFLIEGPLRVVFTTLPLGDNHGSLTLHFSRVDHRIGHAVALDAQSQVQSVGGQDFKVSRVVMAGEAV